MEGAAKESIGLVCTLLGTRLETWASSKQTPVSHSTVSHRAWGSATLTWPGSKWLLHVFQQYWFTDCYSHSSAAGLCQPQFPQHEHFSLWCGWGVFGRVWPAEMSVGSDRSWACLGKNQQHVVSWAPWSQVVELWGLQGQILCPEPRTGQGPWSDWGMVQWQWVWLHLNL